MRRCAKCIFRNNGSNSFSLPQTQRRQTTPVYNGLYYIIYCTTLPGAFGVSETGRLRVNWPRSPWGFSDLIRKSRSRREMEAGEFCQ